ncbi:MAG: cobalt ECF transporter T component CbiQ [Candidatus Omnitrophota bacterium]
MNNIFSEHFSRKENILTRLDARIKIISCVTAIILILFFHTPYISSTVIILTLLSLFLVGIPLKVIILRMSAPLGIALVILFIKIFFYRDTLQSGLLIALKIIGSTSAMLFLSMTTTLDKLLTASRYFKMPRVWVEICLIAYRYVFVLIEDASTVIDAQKVRLGYANLRVTLRSLGTLAGAIIIRAYDQSVATYESMMLRGYKEEGLSKE